MRKFSPPASTHTKKKKSISIEVYLYCPALTIHLSVQDLLGGEVDSVMPSTFITQPDCGVYQLSLHWQSGELIGPFDKDSYYPMLFWQLVLLSGICQPSLLRSSRRDGWMNQERTFQNVFPSLRSCRLSSTWIKLLTFLTWTSDTCQTLTAQQSTLNLVATGENYP